MKARFVLVGGLAMAGCGSIDDAIDIEVRTLAEETRARVGEEPAAWQRQPADEPAAQAAVDALLAEPLTEDSAVKIALLNNRGVQAIYERLGVARADLVQAGLLANPVVDVDAKFFSGGTEIELGLLQPVLDLFFRPLRRRVAEHEFAATKAMLTRELVHLAFNVRREFVRVRVAQRLVALQSQVCDLALATHELMQKLHAAGNVTDPVVTAEHASAARARLDLAAAEQAEREAREPLHVLLGVWGTAVAWQVAGELSDAPEAGLHLDHVEARCVAASLELAESRARIDASAQRAGVVSWEGLLPGASIGVAAKQEATDSWGVGPALTFQLPLFDAGGARVAGAQASLRAALQHHVQLAVETRSAARLLRDRCTSACARAAFLAGELMPVTARFVRETLRNYNAMQIGAFEVLRARRQEVEVMRDHLEAVRDAWLARLDLEELLAGVIDHEALAPRRARLLGGAAAAERGH